MKKKQTQTLLFLLSAAAIAQMGLAIPAYGAESTRALTQGSWKEENHVWKFYGEDAKALTGWVKTASGWYYLDPETGVMQTGWKQIGGAWYYFNTEADGTVGKMRTGWKQIGGAWYFFNNKTDAPAEGQMQTGWQWIDGKCYYFETVKDSSEGRMYAGEKTPDGYTVNENGQWVTGNGIIQTKVGTGFVTVEKSNSSSNSSSSSSSSDSSDSSSGSGSSGSSNSGNSSSENNNTGSNDSNKDDSNTDDSNKDDSDDTEEYTYLLMNIPYDEFYAAELEGNDIDVDAVSSATKTKPRTGSLVGGSYHVSSDGSDITGVIYPVRVLKGTDLSAYHQVTDTDSFSITVTNRGKESTTTYTGKEALFENPSYSYYILSEEPEYYKTLTIGSDGSMTFGESVGESESASATASLSTESTYGDYQLSIEGLPSAITDDDSVTVNGVTIHTEEGEDYGLRHLENIWRKVNLAWSTGFVTTTHGNTLSYDHYESMMGKTITGLTYYTSAGEYEITFSEGVYVPVKFTTGFEMGTALVSEGNTGIKVEGYDTIPADYEKKFTVKDSAGEEAEGFMISYDGQLTWTGTPAVGEYTLVLTDESGKYADVSADFELQTEAVVAVAEQAEDGSWSLKAADGVSEEEFAAYLNAITSVKVGETEYQASGRGAVVIVDSATGKIKLDATSNSKAIFETGNSYSVEVNATGYKNPVTFTLTVSEETTDYEYVLMNIPYNEFYAAELEGNDVDVDAVSSATKSKTKNSGLVSGSYHVNDDGSDITGVTYPVKMETGTDLSAYTEVESEDDLFGNESYAYYVLSDEPEYYKELTVDADGTMSFGEAVDTDGEMSEEVTASIANTSNYGDYQLSFTDFPEEVNSSSSATVYGVVLHTDDGTDYGLRHLENIWRKQNLAWSIGITTTAHGNTLASGHYESMPGKTIDSITYYTSEGIYELTLAKPVKVLEKIASAGKLTITDAKALLDAGTSGIAYTDPSGLPDAYSKTYSVTLDGETADGFSVADGQITWSNVSLPGIYNLTLMDANAKYMEFTAEFELQTDRVVATLSDEEPVLEKTEDATEEEFEAYLSAITSVKVGEKSYSASGRRAVKIIDTETGEIDLTVESNGTAIFAAGKTYTIEITATGYSKNLTFTLTVPGEEENSSAKTEETASPSNAEKLASGSDASKN